jgi:hypothetical protein
MRWESILFFRQNFLQSKGGLIRVKEMILYVDQLSHCQEKETKLV